MVSLNKLDCLNGYARVSKPNKMIEQGLQDILQALSVSAQNKFIVGLSGGLDSIVLLYALASIVDVNKILAIHVNHKLQADADGWEEFCLNVCQSLQVKCCIETVNVRDMKEKQTSSSMEELARNARYAIFEQYVEANNILLTAHHAADQVETLFLQLMRGSGSKGLQSMPINKVFGSGLHVRPFLNVDKKELLVYADEHKIKYIVDKSNADIKFSRNYLRHEVLPVLAKFWPEYQQSILSSIKNLNSERQVLLDMLENSYSSFFQKGILPIANLLGLDANKKVILFRLWLEQHCVRLPPQVRVEEFLRQLNELRQDTSAELKWLNHVVYAYKSHLHFTQHWTENEYLNLNALSNIEFTTCLNLPNAMGEIEILTEQTDHRFSIRFRQGGEALRLRNNQFHSKLKTLFNEFGVFPWWRSRIPLIYANNMLVAVADLWVNADWLQQEEIHDFNVIWHNRPDIRA